MSRSSTPLHARRFGPLGPVLALVLALLVGACTASTSTPPAAPPPALTVPPAAAPAAPAAPAPDLAGAPPAAVPAPSVPPVEPAHPQSAEPAAAAPLPVVLPIPAPAPKAEPASPAAAPPTLAEDTVAATGEALGVPEPDADRPEPVAEAAEAAAPSDEPVAAVAVAEPAAATEATAQEPPPLVLPTLVRRTDGVKTIAIDPGHGGPEIGAVHQTANYGAPLVEKNVNLAIALKLRDILEAEGYAVVLTRDTDRPVHPANTGGYRGGLRDDLQRRIDIANEAGADLFLSIHHNGSNDPSMSGAEVWYNKAREFSDRNVAFARLVLDHLVGAVRAAGYPLVNRGLKDDEYFRVFQGRAYNIYVLGPGTGPRPHVPTLMPGVLSEGAFVSNTADAQMLAREDMQHIIAHAFADAINAYFAQYPD